MKRSPLFGVLLVLIATVGFVLRFVDLEARPMHNDEANQAVRAGTLLEEGTYTYDPIEYHGPTLYYFSLPIAWLTAGRDFAETSERTFRLVTVLFGAGLILLFALVADGMGRIAAVCAALLTALSPAMVYYSRFYIQETLLVFFTFGIIAAGWRWLQSGRLVWALLAGLFVGMAHATKETCIIAFAAIATALAANAMRREGRGSRVEGLVRHVGWAAVVAVVVSVVFFSSFGANRVGPLDSIRTYVNYFRKAGAESVHLHPWYYYLRMLAFSRYGRGPIWSEGLILVLCLVGLGPALELAIKRSRGRTGPSLTASSRACCPNRRDAFGEMSRQARHDNSLENSPSGRLSFRAKSRNLGLGNTPSRADPGFAGFMAVYTVFMAVAYSVIPYKTPWCMLSFLQGMIVLAGIGAATLIQTPKRIWARAVVAALLAIPTGHLGMQAYRGAVTFGADSRNPYVYSQTGTDYLKLVRRVEDIAKVSPEGYNTLIEVIAHPHSTWPLPWDLRKFTRVGYWTEVADVPDVPGVPMIIASPEMADALAARIGEKYLMEFYGLRPDVLLNIYIRRDLWEAFLATRQ